MKARVAINQRITTLECAASCNSAGGEAEESGTEPDMAVLIATSSGINIKTKSPIDLFL
jgi:hypothetical protein